MKCFRVKVEQTEMPEGQEGRACIASAKTACLHLGGQGCLRFSSCKRPCLGLLTFSCLPRPAPTHDTFPLRLLPTATLHFPGLAFILFAKQLMN